MRKLVRTTLGPSQATKWDVIVGGALIALIILVPYVFYPVIVIVAISLVAGAHTFVRIQRRKKRRALGLCPRCGYEMHGSFGSGCPECGWRREGGQREAE